jgi:hypothetical protein
MLANEDAKFTDILKPIAKEAKPEGELASETKSEEASVDINNKAKMKRNGRGDK